MPLISIRGLTKLYRMGDSTVRALDGVDLDIERGEFAAITGASGSGKSTMMHLLGCLDRPTSGQIIFDDRDVNELSDRELAAIRNKQIGFVFQTFNLMNRTSALDNVGVPLFYARRANTRGPARRALERVGLSHRASHRSNELSGGERQRVAIARAIVNDPLLLLADEPTGNLDSHTGAQIMETFRALNQQGVTIVLVTHEHDVAIQARRIVQMRDGKIVSDQPMAEVVAASGRAAPRWGAAAASGGMPGPVAARPAAVATVAGAADSPPRLARGVSASLVCALVGLLILASAWIAGAFIGRPDISPGQVPPTPVLVKVSAVALGFLAALVLAIVAIVRGRGALKRIYNEPGAWKGSGRARIAMVLGWAVVLAPVVRIIAGMIARSRS